MIDARWPVVKYVINPYQLNAFLVIRATIFLQDHACPVMPLWAVYNVTVIYNVQGVRQDITSIQTIIVHYVVQVL